MAAMKNTEPLTRWQAAAWNSAAFTLAFAVTWHTAGFLYPGVFWHASGIGQLMALCAASGFVLGPLLMAYLWVPGKKGLWFDMVVIGLLQLLAWGYGHWLLFSERPAWLVFASDRFVVIRHGEVDAARIADPALRDPPAGRPLLVVAHQPADLKEREAIMFAAVAGGADIDRLPHLWQAPTAADFSAMLQRQSSGLAYEDHGIPLGEALLLVGPRRGLLVHWDRGQQRITAWRGEYDPPSAMRPLP